MPSSGMLHGVTFQKTAFLVETTFYVVTTLEQLLYPRNRPCRPIGVFAVRYEHHLHIAK
jgi:hypothetical protein